MGAGKTTFARALLAGLGVHQPPEGSPTFAIAHEYTSPKGGVVHIDYYRLKSETEIDEAGLPAYYWERKLIVISEWLSSWPDFETQIISSAREGEKQVGEIWRVELQFDPQNKALRQVSLRHES
jgi:tRNA threonylcarbamoyl adenosine modification protein YjeE